MIIVNGATASSIKADIYEPIWIPCLHREFGDGLGFTNIRTCDLVSNYNSNLARIVCHAVDSATLTGVSVTVEQPTIYMKYSTPPTGYVPQSIVYGSEDLNRFITPLGQAIPANTAAPAPITSSNMQLNAIPKWILVFCRESNANLTYASTDTALNISNISINFDNISGILSSASEMDLYKISAENGLQDTWEQWHGVTSNLATQVGTTGSFLKLYFGKDIPLAPGSYPGQIGAYNLSMNVTVKNVNQSAQITAPNLYIITSVPQKLIIHEGGQIETILGISGEDGEYMPYENAMEQYGGSFRDFIKKVSGFLKKTGIVGSVAKLIPVVGPAVSDMIKRRGYGDGGMEVAGMATGGKRGRRAHGDGDGDGDGDGGRVVSRAELMNRIRQYE